MLTPGTIRSCPHSRLTVGACKVICLSAFNFFYRNGPKVTILSLYQHLLGSNPLT